MSNFTWGSKDLSVIDGTYYPPHAKGNIEEIELIPSADNTLPNSILQMGGRSRIETPAFGILLYSFDEVNAFFDDDLAKTVKVFTDPYGLNMSGIIKEFKIGNWKHDQVFECSLIIMEA